MTLHEHVIAAGGELERAGITQQTARLDAELLARHVLGWDQATYLSRRGGHPPTGFETKYSDAIGRRVRREPAPLIIGRRAFWELEFEITRDVLSPRPETELIIEEVMALAARGGAPRVILDAGTGSGCLAVTLARIFPGARIIATDCSLDALRVARRNAERHQVDDRIAWIRTDYLAGVGERSDLIVSNPPYVPAGSHPGLPPEVRDHEPAIALLGGQDGLDGIRSLAAQAARGLASGGWLIFEFGYGQEQDVRRVLAAHGELQLAHIRTDWQGIARTAVAQRT